MKHYIIIFFQIMGNWNVFFGSAGVDAPLLFARYITNSTSPQEQKQSLPWKHFWGFFPTAERPPVPRAVCEVENPLFAQIFVPLFFSSIVMLWWWKINKLIMFLLRLVPPQHFRSSLCVIFIAAQE